MKIKTLLMLLFLVNVAFVTAQTKSKFAPQLDKVLEMLTKKNVTVAQSALHKNYIIAGIFPGAEEQVLPQIFAQLPKFDSYEILSEKKESKGTRIAVNFIKKSEDIKYPSNFLIDKDGIILELNLLESAKIETKFN